MRANENICLQKTTENLIGEFENILPPGFEDMASAEGVSSLGIDRLISEVISLIGGNGSELIGFFMLLFGAAMLAALASSLPSSLGKLPAGAASGVLSFAIFTAMYPLVQSVTETLRSLSEFFSALIPIVSAIPALGGGVSTSATASVGMQLTLWLMGILGGSVLPCVVAAMLASTVIGSAFGAGALDPLKGCGRLYGRLIGIVSACMAGLVALQTFISVGSDSATMRLVRYAASDMIPVVGGAVSGALSTLTGGLSYASGVIGAGSVAVIVMMALSPLVMLLMYKLAFTVVGLFADTRGKDGGVSCISGLSGGLDALISTYTMTIIVYILEIICVVAGGACIFG